MAKQSFKHWQIDYDQENIMWMGLARKNRSVNSINLEVMDEFEELLDQIAQNKKLAGVVIYSAKEHGFIAGADIEQFRAFKDYSQVEDFLEKGQALFNKLEQLSVPTITLIRGFCMGGGTELALATDYRLVIEDDKTRIGLPEVKLGIQPGWGGTVRLPKLIGSFKALPMILQGRGLSPKQAKACHLVDDVVPVRQMQHAVRYFVANRPKPRGASLWQRILDLKPFRLLFAKVLQKKTAKQAKKEHYPQLYSVIDNYREYGPWHEHAQRAEIDSLAKLINHSDTPRNLVRVYFLQERLKSLAKNTDFKAKHVHVIGAGTMGGDIAAWCALRGIRVTLQDRSPEYIAPAIKRAHKLFQKKLKKPHYVTQAMDRLIPDVAGEGVSLADVIIEAIYENLEAKQDLFKDIEAKAHPDAILASNTSSIPLDDINQTMQRPERLVGIHFFNPVAKMPLVEVVSGEETADIVAGKAMAFVGQIDRLPLPVSSSPGFLVNRVLMPYLMECMVLIEEGVSPETIDKAAVNFGMPMGPVELADRVGLDICLAVAENLTQVFGGQIPERLRKMVKNGQLGFKTEQGFYRYRKGKAVKEKVKPQASRLKELAERMVLRMVNESMACLEEGVVADDDLLDAGMIFGTGFAPFRGGPINYARSLGKDNLEAVSTKLEERYGERFQVTYANDMLEHQESQGVM